MRKRIRRLLAPALLATALLAGLAITPPANAHGAAVAPGSRTYLCWLDGLSDTGEIIPNNPACAAAVAQSGTTSLYNWFATLRSDGAGRTRGFIPDGQLCSGAAEVYDFSGFDLPRDDWPLTHLTSGANMEFRYNMWAHHPGWFSLYITKDGFDPNQPLTWDDLEEQPFSVADHPPSRGSVGTADGHYYWGGQLPANKSGRHIIYSVWERSDSTETFYGCSDVVFDGGNGEVTGIGPGSGGPGPGPGPGPDGDCTATFSSSGWDGGFNAQVTVTNTSDVQLSGWTVGWTYASGTQINSLWNGTYTQFGGDVTVRSLDWNRVLAPGGTTSFGFNASGDNSPPTLNCSSP